jgi:hypothetical protein
MSCVPTGAKNYTCTWTNSASFQKTDTSGWSTTGSVSRVGRLTRTVAVYTVLGIDGASVQLTVFRAKASTTSNSFTLDWR